MSILMSSSVDEPNKPCHRRHATDCNYAVGGGVFDLGAEYPFSRNCCANICRHGLDHNNNNNNITVQCRYSVVEYAATGTGVLCCGGRGGEE